MPSSGSCRHTRFPLLHLIDWKMAECVAPTFRQQNGPIPANFQVSELRQPKWGPDPPNSGLIRFTALEQRDGEIDIDNDKAVMVASGLDGTNEVQLWVAPTADGNRECEYVRSSWVQPNGEAAENGPVGCEDKLRPWTDPDFQLTSPSSYLASFPPGSSQRSVPRPPPDSSAEEVGERIARLAQSRSRRAGACG